MSKLAINGGEPLRKKPFPKWPIFDQKEIDALEETCKSSLWGLGGTKTIEFEQKFAQYQDAQYGVCVNNGTVALQVALRAAGVKAGDEVIIPPYTFVATATAVLAVNAVPVFVDIEPDTYNIDPDRIASAVTEKTTAIIPVHIAGRPADMDRIMEVAQKHNLKVVEDCAQAHAAEWRGRKVGAIGDLGCFSFQSSKNLSSGEGGIVITNNKELEERAWSLHNCGRVKEGAWYEHHVVGWNFRLTEWQAAILLVQIERLTEQTKLRNENGNYLSQKLSQIEGISTMKEDFRITQQAYHLFILKYDQSKFKDIPKNRFIEALSAEGIPCSSGYVPLYKEKLFTLDPEEYYLPYRYLGRKPEYDKVHCPVTEKACAEEGIWLYQNMLLGSKEDMDDICKAVEKVKENVDELC